MKLKENMVVNCKTKEESRIFLNECKKQGFNDPYYYEYTDWEYFKEETCYKIYNKNRIRYASKSFYINEGYMVTDFNDLFKTESKFKVGDKVRVKSGLVNGKQYGGITYYNQMSSKEIYNICSVDNDGDYNLDDNKFWYSAEMLEKVKEEKKMSKCKVYEMPDYVGNGVKKVIINEPCVIVILNSGEKGIAKCCPEDKFIEERGYKLALARAIKEKYLNDVVRQDELIKQYIEEFEYKNTIKYYRNEFDKLQRLRSK